MASPFSRADGLAVYPGSDPVARLGAVGVGAEGGNAEITFPDRPEAGSGHPHHVSLAQEPVEEVPRRYPRGGADPDVRGVAPTVDGETGAFQALPEDARVLHVVVDQRPDLLLALRGVDRGGRPLDHVRRTVRLGALPPEPGPVQ